MILNSVAATALNIVPSTYCQLYPTIASMEIEASLSLEGISATEQQRNCESLISVHEICSLEALLSHNLSRLFAISNVSQAPTFAEELE